MRLSAGAIRKLPNFAPLESGKNKQNAWCVECPLLANFVEKLPPSRCKEIICVVSAVSYPRCEGIAAYSENPAETALRGVEVASNCESTFEKISREF